jgi:hypothetical protein
LGRFTLTPPASSALALLPLFRMAFGENVTLDLELLALSGSIVAYATRAPMPQISF